MDFTSLGGKSQCAAVLLHHQQRVCTCRLYSQCYEVAFIFKVMLSFADSERESQFVELSEAPKFSISGRQASSVRFSTASLVVLGYSFSFRLYYQLISFRDFYHLTRGAICKLKYNFPFGKEVLWLWGLPRQQTKIFTLQRLNG